MEPMSGKGPTPDLPDPGRGPSDLATVLARLELLERRLAHIEAGIAAPQPASVRYEVVSQPPAAAGPSPAAPSAPRASRAWAEDDDEPATDAAGPRHEGHHHRAMSLSYSPIARPRLPALAIPALSPGRLLAWVGAAAIVLGAVLFLSLAFSRGWITEPMRVLLGLVTGTAALGGSVLVFDRRQPVMGHVLAAVGVAILELSCYAARMFGIVDPGPALLGTAVVAAAATAIAIRVDAQPIAAFGFLAVLAAPPLMGASATIQTVAFLAIVLVASGVVTIARGWRWLPWIAFVVTLPQLISWAGTAAEGALIDLGVVIGYWLVIAAAAVGEAWRRPRDLRRDPTAALVILVDLAASVLLMVVGDHWSSTAAALIVVAAIQLSFAAVFLVRRSPDDPHGHLLVAGATPMLGVGLVGWLPEVLMPAGLAALVAGLGGLRRRSGRLYLVVEGAVALMFGVSWLTGATFPSSAISAGGFPPVGAARYDLAGSAMVVGSLLAVGAAAMRWSVRSVVERSAVAAACLALVAWAVMYEIGGLGLLVIWAALAVASAILPSRVAALRIDRPIADPLALVAYGLGMFAIYWSLIGFASPVGPTDLISPLVVERLLATLIPLAGLGVLLVTLRAPFWRGATAGGMVVLSMAGIGLLAGHASLTLGPATVDGDLVVLVGWATLALLALWLDEQPRLRLAVPGRDVVASPRGHPLAIAGTVPALGMLGWLGLRFLAPDMGGPLPSVPFTDGATLATAITIGFLLVAARTAHSELVRSAMVVSAAVLAAVLLPIEVRVEWAVAGWCAGAVATLLVTPSLDPRSMRAGMGLAVGLISVAIVTTLLAVAPPDRLFIEITGTPPHGGPPNAATLATLAVSIAVGVLAWSCRATPVVAGRLSILAAALAGWGISVAIADLFAMRLPFALDRTEVARQSQVALSIAWAAMGLVTMLVGLVRDLAPARRAGLVLLAVATAKVFVYDLATLDIGYRVLSLIGLGVLLLVGAWFYLHGRQHVRPRSMER